MAGRAIVKGCILGLAAIAVAGAGIAALARSDVLLSHGFGNALGASRPNLSFGPAPSKEQAQGVTAGDEGYWLTRSEVESPTPFAKPLTIGDRITIAARDGRERRLEVIDLKAIGGQPVRTDRPGHPRLILVTCRVAGETADRAEAHVRFIVEAEPTEPAAPAPAKSL
jgi:hypothetical protein